MLEKMAKNDPEQYAIFWKEFGNVFKEGPAEDSTNKDKLLKLIRFASTHNDSDEQNVSLDDYVSRMRDKQEKIYYLTAESYAAAKNSPHLELFRKKDIEVLLMYDRVDEWMMSYLDEFDGRKLVSIAKGNLDLGDLEDKEEKKKAEKAEKEYKDLLKRMKEVLGEKVKEVRISHRLTDSPSCLVVEEDAMALNMQKLLKQAGQNVPSIEPVLEINPDHLLVERLQNEQDEERFSDWCHVLFDQAMLSEGGQLEDPASFVSRINLLFKTLTDK